MTPLRNLLAYCGISCVNCPAYVASMDGDALQRDDLAREWSTEAYPLSAEDVYCEGCTARDDLVMVFCLDCAVRRCARAKDYRTCAECEEYPCSCLEPVFARVPETCEKLEALRNTH